MDVLQQITAVVAVLALLGGSLWLLRRRGLANWAVGRRSGSRRMEYLERLPLSPQHTLHLVRLGDRDLLLAASPSGCALVESTSHQEVVR
jgi:flagellar biogenesis protein FliO